MPCKAPHHIHKSPSQILSLCMLRVLRRLRIMEHWPVHWKLFTVTYEIEIAQNWKGLSTMTGQCWQCQSLAVIDSGQVICSVAWFWCLTMNKTYLWLISFLVLMDSEVCPVEYLMHIFKLLCKPFMKYTGIHSSVKMHRSFSKFKLLITLHKSMNGAYTEKLKLCLF
jgi:hypothetical protein